jgi:hypothetical protein
LGEGIYCGIIPRDEYFAVVKTIKYVVGDEGLAFIVRDEEELSLTVDGERPDRRRLSERSRLSSLDSDIPGRQTCPITLTVCPNTAFVIRQHDAGSRGSQKPAALGQSDNTILVDCVVAY